MPSIFMSSMSGSMRWSVPVNVPYCMTSLPRWRIRSDAMSASASSGRERSSGMPEANEIIPGFADIAKPLRTTDGLALRTPAEQSSMVNS